MKDFVREEDRRRGRARWGIFVVVVTVALKHIRVSQKFTALAEQKVKRQGLRRRRRRRRGVNR